MMFVWPWVFFLVPLPLFMVLWAGKHKRRQRQTRRKIRKHSEQAIKLPPSVANALSRVNDDTNQRKPPSINTKIIKVLLLTVAWLALLCAIAQPFRPEPTRVTPASGRALALIVDLSTSMEKKDFKINDETVDRLTVVKQIASAFITNRGGDRMGLVLFGSEAFIASPLTYDLNFVATTLQGSGIGMAGRTTAIGDAIGLAIKSLRADLATIKTIVLLSDGTNNSGTAEPEDAAKLASSLGITIHSIGLGSDNANQSQWQFQSASADLDEVTLKNIAETSGGHFFRAHTSDELEKIITQIDNIERSETTAPPILIKRDYRNVFVALLLLCLTPFLLHSTHNKKGAKIPDEQAIDDATRQVA